MRCFVATDVGPKQREEIARVEGSLRAALSGARWTAPDAAHLTLEFLGEIGEADWRRILDGMERLSVVPPIEARLGALGAFPSMKAARVLWMAVDTGGRLEELAAMVREGCRAAGLSGPDDKRFVAHLTLARFRQPKDLGHVELARDSEDTVRGQFLIDRVVLYQSILHPAGAEYRVLGEVILRGTGGSAA